MTLFILHHRRDGGGRKTMWDWIFGKGGGGGGREG